MRGVLLTHSGLKAIAARLFATLELKLTVQHDSRTHAEARRAILRYVETWYNRRRWRSTLGYVSPAEYEAQLHLAA